MNYLFAGLSSRRCPNVQTSTQAERNQSSRNNDDRLPAAPRCSDRPASPPGLCPLNSVVSATQGTVKHRHTRYYYLLITTTTTTTTSYDVKKSKIKRNPRSTRFPWFYPFYSASPYLNLNQSRTIRLCKFNQNWLEKGVRLLNVLKSLFFFVWVQQ